MIESLESIWLALKIFFVTYLDAATSRPTDYKVTVLRPGIFRPIMVNLFMDHRIR